MRNFLTPKLPTFHSNTGFHLHFMYAQIIPPWYYLVLTFLLIFIDCKYIRSLMAVITLHQWIPTMKIMMRHGSPFPRILWGVAPLQFVSYPNEFASDANNPMLWEPHEQHSCILTCVLQSRNYWIIFNIFHKCLFSSMLE